jgi:hypothetical protein
MKHEAQVIWNYQMDNRMENITIIGKFKGAVNAVLSKEIVFKSIGSIPLILEEGKKELVEAYKKLFFQDASEEDKINFWWKLDKQTTENLEIEI